MWSAMGIQNNGEVPRRGGGVGDRQGHCSQVVVFYSAVCPLSFEPVVLQESGILHFFFIPKKIIKIFRVLIRLLTFVNASASAYLNHRLSKWMIQMFTTGWTI